MFALLFHTKFRVFNLAFHDRLENLPEFQQFLGFSLFRLNSLEPGLPHDLEEIAPDLMHPDLAAILPVKELAGGYNMDLRLWMVRSRLLAPLVEFGLVEFEKEEDVPGLSSLSNSDSRFRITPLFHQFVPIRSGLKESPSAEGGFFMVVPRTSQYAKRYIPSINEFKSEATFACTYGNLPRQFQQDGMNCLGKSGIPTR